MSKQIKMLIESATIKIFNKGNELQSTASYSHNEDFPTFIGTREELHNLVMKNIQLEGKELKCKHFIEVNGFEYDGEQDEDGGTWYCHNLITHRSNLDHLFQDYYEAKTKNYTLKKKDRLHESDPKIEMTSVGWFVNG